MKPPAVEPPPAPPSSVRAAPATPPSLARAIPEEYNRAGVDFRTINVSSEGGSSAGPAAAQKPADAKAPPPGATTVGTAGFSTMPFSFGFEGSFFELGKFFNRLDRFVAVRNGGLDVTGRLLLLNSITLTPDTGKGFPLLSAEVSASSYLLPPTEGPTAGATATSPSGSGSSGTPAPSPSSPATTTTATISGATR